MDRTDIHRVKIGEEFSTCQECGYPDAFHTALLRSVDGIGYDIIYICPNCHARFDIGMNTREAFL